MNNPAGPLKAQPLSAAPVASMDPNDPRAAAQAVQSWDGSGPAIGTNEGEPCGECGEAHGYMQRDPFTNKLVHVPNCQVGMRRAHAGFATGRPREVALPVERAEGPDPVPPQTPA